MAQRDIQLEIQTKVESAEAAKSLGALRRSLLDIQNLQQEIGDESSAEFKKLQAAANATQQRMAGLRDSVGDIGDKIRTLEGTPVERLTGSFGLLKEGIMNLDFDKIKIGAEGFLNTLTPVVDGKLVTGFAGIKGAMANLGTGIVSLGRTFAAVGASLLTNPIFLIAAAVAAIVAVIVILLNRLGLLKPMLELVGAYFQMFFDVIDFGIKKLQDLSDWLFGTGFAAEREAKKVQEAEQRKRDAYELTIQSSNQLRDITISNMEEGEAKRKAILAAEFADAQAKLKLDEQKAIADTMAKLGWTVDGLKAVQQITKNYADIREQMEISHQKKLTKVEDDAQKERIKKTEENNNKRITATQKGYDDLVKIGEENVKKEKDGSLEQLEAFKTAKANELEYVKKHYQDLGINLKNYEEEYNRAIEQEVKNYNDAQEKKRLANEVVLAEIKTLEAQSVLDKAKTDEEKLAAENNLLEAQKQLIKAKLAEQLNDETLTEEQRKLITMQADKEIFDAETQIQTQREDRNEEAKEKEKERLAELQAIRDVYNISREENEIARLQRELERDNLSKEEKQRLMDELMQHEVALIQEKERQAIAALDAEYERRKKLATTDEERLMLEQWYGEEKKRINTEATEQEKEKRTEATEHFKQEKQKEIDSALQAASKTLGDLQKFSDLGFAIFKNTKKKEKNETDEQRKKRLQEEEKAARIQFNINKGLQIGQAVIAGIQSILAITSVADPTLGIQTAIRIAGQVALNALSIAKIISTQYEPSGGGGDTSTNVPPPPTVAGGGSTAPQIPSFTPAQFFNVGQAQPGAAGGTQPIQVVVTETDITDTQTRVRVIEDRATID